MLQNTSRAGIWAFKSGLDSRKTPVTSAQKADQIAYYLDSPHTILDTFGGTPLLGINPRIYPTYDERYDCNEYVHRMKWGQVTNEKSYVVMNDDDDV